MVAVDYYSSLAAHYDIMHLLSIEDENKMNAALENNIPVVVSTLNTESDPNASFITYKNKDGKITNSLSNKVVRFLNKASLVLVPTLTAEEFLRQNGVKAKIEVLLPGINFSRFDFSRDDEKEIFYRYFREDKNKKLVIANGDYNNLEGIGTFIDTAKKCPNASFYYFGEAKNNLKTFVVCKKLNNSSPKNCHFVKVATDDIYRSALLNADIFMVTSYKHVGVVSILEAMAAKCQLIVREQACFKELIKDGKTGYLAKFSETLSALVKDYFDGKLKSTTFEAYESIKENNLLNMGEKLKAIYERETNNKD